MSRRRRKEEKHRINVGRKRLTYTMKMKENILRNY